MGDCPLSEGYKETEDQYEEPMRFGRDDFGDGRVEVHQTGKRHHEKCGFAPCVSGCIGRMRRTRKESFNMTTGCK